MDEAFESTLANAPLTEEELIAEVFQGSYQYRVVRDISWQGPDARGGRRLTAPSARRASEAMKITEEKNVQKVEVSYWEALSGAAGGGQKGSSIARGVQKWLVQYVESLPLDEIELMAGEKEAEHA